MPAKRWVSAPNGSQEQTETTGTRLGNKKVPRAISVGKEKSVEGTIPTKQILHRIGVAYRAKSGVGTKAQRLKTEGRSHLTWAVFEKPDQKNALRSSIKKEKFAWRNDELGRDEDQPRFVEWNRSQKKTAAKRLWWLFQVGAEERCERQIYRSRWRIKVNRAAELN